MPILSASFFHPLTHFGPSARYITKNDLIFLFLFISWLACTPMQHSLKLPCRPTHFSIVRIRFSVMGFLKDSSIRNLYNRVLYVTGLYMCDLWEQRMCLTLISIIFLVIILSAFVFLPSDVMAFYSYLQSRRASPSLTDEL